MQLAFALRAQRDAHVGAEAAAQRVFDATDLGRRGESALESRSALGRALHGASRAVGRGLPDRVVDVLLRLGGTGLSLRALREAPHGVDLGPLRSSRGAAVRTRGRRPNLAPAPLVADVPRLEAWVDEVTRASAAWRLPCLA